MNFYKKIKFFSIGLFMGTFFLITILNGKKMSCNYGPESRVIKNLKQKKWILDKEIIAIDNSKVIFNKSDTKKDSCKVYYLRGLLKYKKINIEAENCSKIVYAKVIKS